MSLIRTPMGIYVLSEDEGLSRHVQNHQTLEVPDNMRDIPQVAPFIPEGGVVIDAGACIGDQTVMYSQIVGRKGWVYAFEPHPEAYKALVKNTARLRNVKAFDLALSDSHLPSMLALTPNAGASFIAPVETEWPRKKVSLTSIDWWFGFNDSPQRMDFIHLDAEGYEPKILKGAEQTIKKFRPVLMVEVRDTWLKRYGSSAWELLNQLKGLGYNSVPLHTNPDQFDVLALPAERYTVDRQNLDTLTVQSHTVGASA